MKINRVLGSLLVWAATVVGCAETTETEAEDEELGEVAQASCILSASTRPSPVFVESLDGSTTEVDASDTPSTDDCDFVAMQVDTDPDRAEIVAVGFQFVGQCDGVSKQAAVWKRTGTAPWFGWTLSTIPIGLTESGDLFTTCTGLGTLDLGTNSYTQVVVGGHAEKSDGTPIYLSVLASE